MEAPPTILANLTMTLRKGQRKQLSCQRWGLNLRPLNYEPEASTNSATNARQKIQHKLMRMLGRLLSILFRDHKHASLKDTDDKLLILSFKKCENSRVVE